MKSKGILLLTCLYQIVLSGYSQTNITYWFDDNFENRTSVAVNAGSNNFKWSNDIAVPDDFKDGVHRLTVLCSANNKPSPATTYYFLKHSEEQSGDLYAQYWFDDNEKSKVQVPLINRLTFLWKDSISTSSLDKGIHKVNIQIVSNDLPSPVFSQFFCKGLEPEPFISEYVYWFDGEDPASSPYGSDTVRVTPSRQLQVNQAISLPEDISKGYHAFNIKFKDLLGQWSEVKTDTFFSTVGLPVVHIKNLEPDVNPIGYTVKNLATIFRYYQIADIEDKPVSGVQIEYSVNGISYLSKPSDESGLAAINFPVWGKDANDETDDYVPAGTTAEMSFVSLKMNGKELKVAQNAFNLPYRITVLPFFPDDMHYGLTLGESQGSVSDVSETKGKADYTLTFGRLFNEFYEQTGWDVKTEMKAGGEFSDKIKGKLPVFPLLSLEGALEIGGGIKLKGAIKETLPYTNASYLKIAHSIFSGIWTASPFADENIHFMLNVLSEKLGIGDETTQYKESSSELFVKTGISGKASIGKQSKFDLGVEQGTIVGVSGSDAIKYDGSSESLIYKDRLSADIEIKVKGVFNDGTSNFGLTVAKTISSSIGITTERPRYLTGLNKSSVAKVSGWELAISPSWGSSQTMNDALVYNQIRSISGKLGKKYTSTFSLDRPILDAAGKLDIKDPLWGRLTNKTEDTGVLFGTAFTNHLETINAGLSKIAQKDYQDFTKSAKWTVDKEYEVVGNFTYKKEFKFVGLKWDIGFTGGVFSKCTFPVSESYYHFGTKKSLLTYQYEDLNRFRDIIAPSEPLIENINAGIDALIDLDSWIKDNCSWYKRYADKTDAFLGNIIYKLWYAPSGAPGRKRSYSPALNGYRRLINSTQKDISNMAVVIPCAKQDVFHENTEVHFSHYYPGGEVLGATTEKDTIIIVSDIGFLNAYYSGDTLTTAPNGKFKIYATAGADDLMFLEIDEKYPVGVYHKPYSESLWSPIGNTNDTIQTNSLGKFCLGVSVGSDKTPPVININKAENSSTLEITITDNMAVYWKNTFILVNGVVTEYTRDQSRITVQLTEEQLADDLYVTIYASDLARNKAEATKVFEVISGVKSPVNESCRLYPVPAEDFCYLVIESEMLNSTVEYALINQMGQIITQKPISALSTQIDVSQLPRGVYFVVVYNEKGLIANKRLVKK